MTTPASSGTGLGFLWLVLVAAAAVIVWSNSGRGVDAVRRSESFQGLVGGLGTEACVDVTHGAQAIDARVAAPPLADPPIRRAAALPPVDAASAR